MERPSTTIAKRARALLRTLLQIFIRIPPKDSYEYRITNKKWNTWPIRQTSNTSAQELYRKRRAMQIAAGASALLLKCDREHTRAPVLELDALVCGKKHRAIASVARPRRERKVLNLRFMVFLVEE